MYKGVLEDVEPPPYVMLGGHGWACLDLVSPVALLPKVWLTPNGYGKGRYWFQARWKLNSMRRAPVGAGQVHDGGPLDCFDGDDAVAIGQEPDEP